MFLVTFLPLILLVSVAAAIFLLILWIVKRYTGTSGSDMNINTKLMIQRQQELMEENEHLKERITALEDKIRQQDRHYTRTKIQRPLPDGLERASENKAFLI